MNEAVFYPKQDKILINAYFYSFWISPQEFKKYNLEYKIAHSKYNSKYKSKYNIKYNSKNIETTLRKLEEKARKIKI